MRELSFLSNIKHWAKLIWSIIIMFYVGTAWHGFQIPWKVGRIALFVHILQIKILKFKEALRLAQRHETRRAEIEQEQVSCLRAHCSAEVASMAEPKGVWAGESPNNVHQHVFDLQESFLNCRWMKCVACCHIKTPPSTHSLPALPSRLYLQSLFSVEPRAWGDH